MVANFVQNERDEIEDTISVEAVVSLAVLVVTLGAGWIIAGRLLRPIRRLTDTARTITDTDLSQRIPVDANDEIGDLADTFNGCSTDSTRRSPHNERSSTTPGTSCAPRSPSSAANSN